MAFRFRIDRSLSVSVTAQLRGQLEYGVALGQIAAGEALPSVRELAERLGLAPVTVAQVYRELQAKGLLETSVGRGTFVRADAPRTDRPDHASYALDELSVRLLRTARELNLGADDVSQMVAVRLARLQEDRLLRLLLVGNFVHATRRYARILRRYLSPDDRVAPTTVAELVAVDDVGRATTDLDAVLTPAYRVAEVRALIGADAVVITLPFLPASATRQRLTALSPLDRVGLVSADEDYLVTFRESVERYAPHLDVREATFLDDPALAARLEACDVVVHATGADAAADAAPSAAQSFEFRFEPHPRLLVQDVLPRLHALRSSGTQPATPTPREANQETPL